MATNKCKPMPQLTAKQIERFWKKVDRRGPEECWPWKGLKSPRGYGVSMIRVPDGDGKKAKIYRANRLALFISTGVDPLDLLACHSCDNPPCCNPAHLWAGDTKANSVDSRDKGRRPNQSGEHNAQARLNAKTIVAIRLKCGMGVEQLEVAKEYGISQQHVSDIVLRKRWAHVE